MSYETVYENPWFRVRRQGNYHHIENTKEGGCILLREGEHWVFVINKRHTCSEPQIEAPRGCLSGDETGRQGAARELYEETGVRVQSSDFTLLGHCRPDTGLLAACVPIYYIEAAPGSAGDIQDTQEIDSLIRVTDEELTDLIRSGKIQCAMTLSAIALYRALDASLQYCDEPVVGIALESIELGGASSHQVSIITHGSGTLQTKHPQKGFNNKEDAQALAESLAERYRTTIYKEQMNLVDLQ